MGPRSPGWRSTGNPRPWEGEGADADALTSPAWRWGGTVFDWAEVARLFVGSSAAVALICQTGLVIREQMRGQTEITKIQVASDCKVAETMATADADVIRIWATSEAKIAEMTAARELERERRRDRRQLGRPDQLLGDLAQLQPERDAGDHRKPGAARG
jgi:hypothetical protein